MALVNLNEESGFEYIIGVVLNNWSPLKVAIQQGMGGTNSVMKLKINDLIKNIYECLQNSGEKKCWSSISYTIEDVMDLGFDVELQVDSADEIGKQIYRLFREWGQSIDSRQKVLRELKKFPFQKPIQLISVHQIRENTEEEDSSSSEETVNPMLNGHL